MIKTIKLSLSAMLFLTLSTNTFAQVPPSAQDIRGHWLTDDSSVVVEITQCRSTSSSLCGFIRALPTIDRDKEIEKFANELCGLPLLANLNYNPSKNRWDRGEMFDPETEKSYDAYARLDGNKLLVRVYVGKEWFGESMHWTKASPSAYGCESLKLDAGRGHLGDD